MEILCWLNKEGGGDRMLHNVSPAEGWVSMSMQYIAQIKIKTRSTTGMSKENGEQRKVRTKKGMLLCNSRAIGERKGCKAKQLGFPQSREKQRKAEKVWSGPYYTL